LVTTVSTRIVTTTELREKPVECAWTLPAPPAGQTFDRQRVNVQLSAPLLSSPLGLGQVAGASACAERGWYYDNASAPTRLIACPQTCTLLQATAQARVEVLLGCSTVALL
jgi:hypothetical protein